MGWVLDGYADDARMRETGRDLKMMGLEDARRSDNGEGGISCHFGDHSFGDHSWNR